MSQVKQGMARFLGAMWSLPGRLVSGRKISDQNGDSKDPRSPHRTRYVKEVIEHPLGQTFVFTSDPAEILPEDLYLEQLAEEAYGNYCKSLLSWLADLKFAGMAVAREEIKKTGSLSRLFIMPHVLDVGEVQSRIESEVLTKARPRILAQELLTLPRRQVVLLGVPGSGKSTLLSFMALMLAQHQPYRLGLPKDTHWLPILIRLRQVDPGHSILEFLQETTAERFQSMGAHLPENFFTDRLRSGNSLILLDGLDEALHQDEITQKIEDFLRQFPENRAILTSRPLHYFQAHLMNGQLPVYELQQFDSDQIDSFVDRWYDERLLGPEEASQRSVPWKRRS